MALKEVDRDTFDSVTPAWPPQMRAFGGHVYAQAAYAASKTVAGGMFIHVCFFPRYLVKSIHHLTGFRM